MTQILKTTWLRSFSIAMSIVLPAVAPTLAYAAGNLNIQVLDKGSGKAIDQAAVCLGTRANPQQFGAARTGADGVATFGDPPSGSFVVTVSRPGFKGGAQILGPSATSRMFVLKISPGGGGPQCDAPADLAVSSGHGGLAITQLSVVGAGDPGKVLVSARVRGTANQIRISETADFAGAEWQDLRTAVPYSLGQAAGGRVIYVQVRRHAQLEGANIEVVSPVRSINYRP